MRVPWRARDGWGMTTPSGTLYESPMNGFLIFLLITAMLATLAVLVIGLFAMARGGEFNERHGNRLMWWRVRLQVVALVLFALAFLSSAA